MNITARTTPVPATTERIEELEAHGYEVEDLGLAWGQEFEGQYRWNHTLTGDFQDYDTSSSVADAWAQCAAHAATKGE